MMRQLVGFGFLLLAAARADGQSPTAPLRAVATISPDELDATDVAGGVVRLDGTLILADPGDLVLRSATSSGKTKVAWGRRGEGPGEFLNIRKIAIVGDTVWVVDNRLHRVQAFIGDGRVVASRRFSMTGAVGPDAGGVMWPVSVHPSGATLERLTVTSDGSSTRGAALRTGQVGLVVRQPDGTIRGDPILARSTSQCNRLLDSGINFVEPFCTESVADATPDGRYAVLVEPLDSKERIHGFRVRWVDPLSGSESHVELPVPMRTVSRAQWDSVEARNKARLERHPSLMRAWTEARSRTATFPPFDAVVALQDGAVAVRSDQQSATGPIWWLFRAGQQPRAIRIPGSERPLAYRNGWLWVRWEDEDGAIGVKLYNMGRM